MSLSLFHKFVEIRACGRQRTHVGTEFKEGHVL